ncbi:hypothetical protein ABBQ38_002104 [Trebouxia sp. C0009 RCD-2024]
MQLSGGQRVSQSMHVLSGTYGPNVAGWDHHRGVPGRSLVPRAPLQHHDKTSKADQAAQRHRMQIKVLSGAAAQTHTGTKAAVPKQLPELPSLDDSYQDNVKFTPYANWLIPGHLMVGRYPYVEPSRCRRREKGEAQVRKVVEAGITTFVCLQEELPAQDKMKIGGHRGFMPYMAVAQGIAASLNGPGKTAEMDGIRNSHIDKFLPPKRKSEESEHRELSFVYDPIVDLNLPDRDQMLALVEQLKGFILDGQVVYMHCWGGRGRAGTIASCFLASCYHLSAQETADRVQLAFDTRNDEGRRSPETPDQREFVKKFVHELEEMNLK